MQSLSVSCLNLFYLIHYRMTLKDKQKFARIFRDSMKLKNSIWIWTGGSFFKD